MLFVGLTGGIGSGKSLVASMLERLGAVVIDADQLARRAVEPGTDGARRVVERFGEEAVRPDGSIDRETLARTVFADPQARADLEAIVHPEVGRMLATEVDAYRATDRVVVHAVPLLVESGLAGAFDIVATVSASEETRLDRLRADRSMDREDALARMRAQASDADREAVADVVIANEGSIEDLRSQVERIWGDWVARARSEPDGPAGPAS